MRAPLEAGEAVVVGHLLPWQALEALEAEAAVAADRLLPWWAQEVGVAAGALQHHLP